MINLNKNSHKNHDLTQVSRSRKPLYAFMALFAVAGIATLVVSFAQTPSTSVTTHAKNMKLPAGASIYTDTTWSGRPRTDVKMTASGKLTGTFTTTADSNLLTLVTRGDQCNGAPRAIISIDGKVAFTTEVAKTTWYSQRAIISLPAGTHAMEVAFTNASSSASLKCARNLYVDRVVVEQLQNLATVPPSAPVTVRVVPDHYQQQAGSERVAQIGNREEKVIYSQQISDLRAGDVLDVQAESEVSNPFTSSGAQYPVYFSSKLVLANSADAVSGVPISNYSGLNISPDMHHWPSVKAGNLTVPVGAGQHVNLVAYGSSGYVGNVSVLTVERLGHLSVTRYRAE